MESFNWMAICLTKIEGSVIKEKEERTVGEGNW